MMIVLFICFFRFSSFYMGVRRGVFDVSLMNQLKSLEKLNFAALLVIVPVQLAHGLHYFFLAHFPVHSHLGEQLVEEPIQLLVVESVAVVLIECRKDFVNLHAKLLVLL